jgi:hypothetical protein
MPYLGTKGLKASDIRRFNVTGSTSATHTLTWVAPTEQSLIVTINGVKQQEDAYSVSGTTLTLTSALVVTDKMEVVGINDVGTTVTPAQNSVNLDKLATTGTASSSTFLRGDMAWTTVSDTSGLASMQVFTSSGTWTKPSGVTKIIVEVQGAGGSGNGGIVATGASGAGGGYAKKLIDVSSISTATVTVGSGGASTTSLTGNGGGNSIWSDGTNTITCNGGSAPSNVSNEVVLGGTSSGGDLNIKGQNGGSRGNYNSYFDTGIGGSSFLGIAGRPSHDSASSDNDATGYGSGGGMRNNIISTGGAGANGIVIVTEYK